MSDWFDSTKPRDEDAPVRARAQLPEPTMRELNPYRFTGNDPYNGATHLSWYTADQLLEYAQQRATAAEARIAELEAKAARYDWLKSNGIIRVFPMSSGMMSRGGSRILADTKDWLPGDFTYVIDGVTKDVDAAIDAAMSPGGKVIVGGEKPAAISQAEVERDIALADLSAVRDILDPDRIRLTAEQAAHAARSTRDYLMGEIDMLRGRAENAEAQIQDSWRELACSDDISALLLSEAINQLQRAREAAEAVADRRLGALKQINLLTSPGGSTFDELMRDMNNACDIARSAIELTGTPVADGGA